MSNSEKQPQRNGDQERTGYQEISQRKKGRLIETHTLDLVVHINNPSMRRRKIRGSRPPWAVQDPVSKKRKEGK